MLKRGQPTAAIAERLGISPITVRRHISTTMRKTRSVDRRALVGETARRAGATSQSIT
jgi:DNA-binding CsgD family transcriptional regulator